MPIRYAPEFFNRTTVEEMRGVILSPYGGLSVEERWEIETEWLRKRIKFPDYGIVVDFGCGIGRMAKAIERPVMGVDISLPMLMQAVAYVARTDFIPVAPLGFQRLVECGFRAVGGMAIWSLQHVLDIEAAVELLMRSLKSHAPFYLVDLRERFIPIMTDGEFGMAGDGKDVLALLKPWCEQINVTLIDLWKDDPHNPGALYEFRRKALPT